jgi:radical SAM protein with 4Fe4S-binding SPASM domain
MKRILETLRPCRGRLKSLAFSGGEPTLRNDLPELIAAARLALPRADINVATNARLLDGHLARTLKASGAQSIQITLLSARPEMHDAMTGSAGSHDSAIAGIAAAKSAGLLVAVFFVGTRCNIADFPGAAKLAFALGADTVIFNRFQPGGRALSQWKKLTPGVTELETAWRQIAELGRIAPVSPATILPPCETPNIARTAADVMACPIGTKTAYPTIDPVGNLRCCNHWPLVAGSLFEKPFRELLRHPALSRETTAALPAECADCRWASCCRGGCLAARDLAEESIYARGGVAFESGEAR